MLGRNDPCFCGSGKKWKKCHYPFQPESKETLAARYLAQYRIVLKNDKQIEGIRRACRLSAEILKATLAMAKEGVTTKELDAFAAKLHREAGARAAPLNYGTPPYPFSICTSLNDVICHGFPDDTPLQSGDILNIDVSSILEGYFGDCSAMAIIGKASSQALHVVEVSRQCLQRGCEVLKPAAMLSEIGCAIEKYATQHGCSVVHEFVGHGVGLAFHEPPQVPHFANDMMIPLVPGMIFTIEPMINAGRPEGKFDANQWTNRTVDGSLSAQWEHTVLITETGSEILTL